jgi:hypothetical protein
METGKTGLAANAGFFMSYFRPYSSAEKRYNEYFRLKMTQSPVRNVIHGTGGRQAEYRKEKNSKNPCQALMWISGRISLSLRLRNSPKNRIKRKEKLRDGTAYSRLQV